MKQASYPDGPVVGQVGLWYRDDLPVAVAQHTEVLLANSGQSTYRQWDRLLTAKVQLPLSLQEQVVVVWLQSQKPCFVPLAQSVQVN